MAEMYEMGTDGDNAAQPATPAAPQQATLPPNEPAAPAGDEGAVPVIDLSKIEDPDLRDLYEAQAQLGEVTLAGQQQDVQQPTDQGNGQPAAPAAPAQPAAPKAGEQPMIPKARFDEVNSALARAREEAAFFRGVAEASRTAPQAGDQPQPQAQQPQPTTFEGQLASLRSQEKELAEQYDNGDLTYTQLTEKQAAIRDAEFTLRQEQLRAPVQPTVTVEQVKAQLEAEQQEVQLYQAHPYAALVFPTNPEANPGDRALMDARREALKAEANVIMHTQHGNVVGTAQADAVYRNVLATLADQYGPTWFPQANIQHPSPQAAGKPAMSPTAQARLDKMGVARNQPADIGALGVQAGADQFTPEAIAAMSDDEFARLPDHVRRRFL